MLSNARVNWEGRYPGICTLTGQCQECNPVESSYEVFKRQGDMACSGFHTASVVSALWAEGANHHRSNHRPLRSAVLTDASDFGF